jgi:glucose/arabinose dehydrogenase
MRFSYSVRAPNPNPKFGESAFGCERDREPISRDCQLDFFRPALRSGMKEALTFIVLAAAISLPGAEKKVEDAKVVTTVLRPAKSDFTQERMRQLQVAPGFKIDVFATNLGNARMMLPLPNGEILLSRYDEGDVLALSDKDNDGRMDAMRTVVNIPHVHGLALRGDKLYLASTTKLFELPMTGEGTFGQPREFAQLAYGGQHPRRTIGFDDDGWLYVSIGSTCNNCEEANPEHAAMIRMRPDGSERKIFASGLRNTIGFDWHPQTRELWGMDHGSDLRGNNTPPEELNRIKADSHYGWPWCYGQQTVDKLAHLSKKNTTKEELCEKTVPMALGYQAHAAPIAFVFYNGNQFPAEYRCDGFTAMHGSWNRDPAVGYELVRVRFNNGRPQAFEKFVTGWLIDNGKAHFGRPAGLAVAKDGALLMSDDANGVIYRITHAGGGQ